MSSPNRNSSSTTNDHNGAVDFDDPIVVAGFHAKKRFDADFDALTEPRVDEIDGEAGASDA